MSIPNNQPADGDWRVEVSPAAECRGKVWIYNKVTKRQGELHFDAASWGDLQRLLALTQRMIEKEQGMIVVPRSTIQ